MNYLDALRLVHRTLEPEFYVEIGCHQGESLELANCPSLAIDPDHKLTRPLTQPTRIYRETSDQFFARDNVSDLLGRPPDLAFIDGMHLVEFALRDFINLEKHAASHSVIVVDDVVPGEIAWTARERATEAWTGDIYKLIPILRQYRPDLEITVFDATIIELDKGLAIISNLDPENHVLSKAYDEIATSIERGVFNETSIEDIRNTVQVCAPDELSNHIAKVATNKPYRQRAAATEKPRTRYLQLLKKSLLNEIYLEDEFRLIYLRDCLNGKVEFELQHFLDIRARDPDMYTQFEKLRLEGRLFENKLNNLGFAMTMIGRLRLENLHQCLDLIRKNNIPGDVAECGVLRGGGCIFMSGYLEVYNMTDRSVIVADSFQGLPVPSHPKDANLDLSRDKVPELAISREIVERNFAAYDLLGKNVKFVEGWFKDTLIDTPTDKLALLRLDGDLYESTMDILSALYDKVATGGVVIIDDYSISACRQAFTDFFVGRGEQLPDLTKIDWTGVYFIKRADGD